MKISKKSDKLFRNVGVDLDIGVIMTLEVTLIEAITKSDFST